MRLFELVFSQRRFALLALAVLAAAGLWSALRLPSAIYPELRFPRITVVAQGSVLDARQVLFGIVRPIEEAVSTVPGVERVRSRAIRGAAEISVSFAPRTDMAYALQLVRGQVAQIGPQLPPGVDVQVELLTPSLFPILSYNLEGGDPATLYDVARYELKPVLSRVPGVARVDVQASDVREIEVVADPGRLAALGMSYDDLAAAIRQTLAVDAVGRVEKDYQQYLVVTDPDARSEEDVGAVVLPNGLRVRDVATVEWGVEDRVRLVMGDGKPAALINVSRQIGGNTVAVADGVARATAALAPSLPAGVFLKPVYDQAVFVREAVKSVRDAILIGAGLAVLVLLAFLRRWRPTVITAASIPLTLVLTVLGMRLLGETFNLMTLGALAIAIGLVIDDAVVVTENIERHLAVTADRRQAIREAVRELAWPITTSTITTVVVFLPLGLLQGVVGQFFAALSITLTLAVLISLALALTVIPLLSEQFLGLPRRAGPATPGGRRGPLARMARALDGLADRYASSLASVLRRPRWIAVAAALLVVAGLLAQRRVGTGFLPEMDEGAFVLDYFTPGGTALAETDRLVRIAEDVLAHTPDIVGTSRRTGAELGLFATQQNSGDIVARLAPPGQRSRDIFAVIDDVRGRIERAAPRLHIEFVQLLSDLINDLAGGAKPVEIKLFGERLEELESYARALTPALSAVPGLVDLYDGVSEPSAEMLMRIDEAEARRAGLTPQQVSAAVGGSLLGVSAGTVRSEDRAIGIRVRAPDRVRFDPQQLGALPVGGGSSGDPVPLSALAAFQTVHSRAELNRENQQQMIAVTADITGRSLGGVVDDVKRVLAARPAPHGVRVELGGQYASQQQAFHALLGVLALAVVSVIGVMLVQFESFVEPLVIVLAAPISFVGAIALLLATGTALNVSSFMGLILLVGLIVKNGIILLDFTRRRLLAGGVSLEEALREAARIRLRPILMTTLCTLLGLAPLALGLGAGSELQRPLALAVIGGLALSTPVTLYVVPTLLVAVRGRSFAAEGASHATKP